MALSIQPLTELIGAEVTGIDLKEALPTHAIEQLQQTLVERIALVFRGQRFTPAQYLKAVRIFGKPMRQHYSQYNMEGLPHVSVISHRNGQEPASVWHTDHTNHICPPKATILYAVSVPTTGGNTSIANMRAAYAALPIDMQRELRRLYTVNSLDKHLGVRKKDSERYGRPVRHPLVRAHPETGTKALYFHPVKATHIEGMTPEASRTLLQTLIETAIKPEMIYRHEWRVGDMLIFDNRSAMHKAHVDYDRSENRLLYRIILTGDRPV